MSDDLGALRRRIYDAARRPAIRLSDATLALAQRGGVFHLNGSEADEIVDAVAAVVEPILAEREQLATLEVVTAISQDAALVDVRYRQCAEAAVAAASAAINHHWGFSGTTETAKIEAVGRIASALILADRGISPPGRL